MKTVQTQLGDRSYPIHIGPGLLDDAALLRTAVDAAQVLIVTNEVVAPLYLQRVRSALAGLDIETIVLPDGESYKTLATFQQIIDRLIERRFHRDACVVALGGGVVGDVAGFAAASYQRGIRIVQVPTSLLAQVDSSVGGKTAVNHPQAKNMIGAFHQPAAVLADTDTLTSLPPRELAAGLAEVIKYGLIVDAAFFDWLETHIGDLLELDAAALMQAIATSCETKAQIVAADEREQGQRALLNLGHTFGHALEALGHYDRWLHGEAVAIGTVLAAETSAGLGWIDQADCQRIENLLRAAKLPTRAAGIDADTLLERMRLDKKAGHGGLRLVLLKAIGQAVLCPAPEHALLHRITAAGLAA